MQITKFNITSWLKISVEKNIWSEFAARNVNFESTKNIVQAIGRGKDIKAFQGGCCPRDTCRWSEE